MPPFGRTRKVNPFNSLSRMVKGLDQIVEDICLVYCALADRQRAAAFDIFCRGMQELLRQIDLEYYRSVRLLIVRAKLQQLRQESLALADVERKKAAPRAAIKGR